ncbi:SDR family oxidoreductase [Pseudomonas sp. MSSRFD41]|uniref:SDR family oxidoreductase n=1 Tax=Pseudomonas sp. MSSRFD41 TaxID=1310370 RepID=UPI0016398034|nr:SDR family oxidoreductase [Pseudomonas sp. MSSRFD41]MBC2659570.1 SDR family oxidoreductase [Pseudomonas sp. MSSRFD41]
MDLTGKRALVTAAGQGIGRATALAFEQAGAEVIAVDIDAVALSAFDGVCAVQCDLTSRLQIQRLVAEVGHVDVLFNCAGIVHGGTVLQCSEQDWEQAFALNVTSMFRLIRAFLPSMVEAGYGNLINMSSVASSIKGVSGRFAYSASKAAVIGLTRSIAADYVKQGIRCNAICPGTVDSPSLRERIRMQAEQSGRSTEQVYDEFVARQPLGRLGSAAEIAQLALYLASDASAFVTGTTQIIDGGWSN